MYETKEIPIGLLRTHPLQPRDRREIADVRESIDHLGQILDMPIVMENQSRSYDILSGHRRIQAAKALGYKAITCIVREPMDMAAQLTILAAANTQQELTPLQRARMLQQAMEEHHLSFDEACEAMGLEPLDGRTLLRLLKAPEPVQQAMKKGDLSYGVFRRELVAMDNDGMLEAIGKGTTRKSIQATKRRMEIAEAPERLVDDSSDILAALTQARKAIAKTTAWLVGSESAARAEVTEALRGIMTILESVL